MLAGIPHADVAADEVHGFSSIASLHRHPTVLYGLEPKSAEVNGSLSIAFSGLWIRS